MGVPPPPLPCARQRKKNEELAEVGFLTTLAIRKEFSFDPHSLFLTKRSLILLILSKVQFRHYYFLQVIGRVGRICAKKQSSSPRFFRVIGLLLACSVVIFTQHFCFLVFYKNICLKEGKDWQKLISNIYCLAFTFRFAVFVHLSSFWVSSLVSQRGGFTLSLHRKPKYSLGQRSRIIMTFITDGKSRVVTQ